jgi:hypothetical protein
MVDLPPRVRLVVLFGGRSAEHDISCISVRHVLDAVDPGRYEVVPVGISAGRSAGRRAGAGQDGQEVEGGPLRGEGCGGLVVGGRERRRGEATVAGDPATPWDANCMVPDDAARVVEMRERIMEHPDEPITTDVELSRHFSMSSSRYAPSMVLPAARTAISRTTRGATRCE